MAEHSQYTDSPRGKTVERVEDAPTGSYGSRDHGTVLIHFTDGTALAVTGSSYEEVDQSWELEPPSRVRERQHAAQGRREQERVTRLKRAGWLALTCEERGERKRQREARMSTFAFLMKKEFQSAIMDVLLDNTRYGQQKPQTIRRPCKNCGERECPNAPVQTVYRREAGPTFGGGYFTIPVSDSAAG